MVFDNPAERCLIVPARSRLVLEGKEFFSEGSEELHLLLDRGQLPRNDRSHVIAGRLTPLPDGDEILDLPQCEADRLCFANEAQPLPIGRAIEAVPSLSPLWGRQQADLLVVPDGFRGESNVCRQFSDPRSWRRG